MYIYLPKDRYDFFHSSSIYNLKLTAHLIFLESFAKPSLNN